MLNRQVVITLGLIVCILISVVVADELEDNFHNYLHYIKIGRLDIAKSYAEAVIKNNPDPKVVLGFVEDDPRAAFLMRRASENEHDLGLAEYSRQILEIIEQGKFSKRTESAIIAEEVRRLTSTARGRLTAVKRLKTAGEYAIPFMLDAMADVERRNELGNIIWALPQIGKDAIRPSAAALQTDNLAVKAEIIKALGGIGYPQALGHLKYVVENDSSQELRELAAVSIKKIDTASLNLPAAELLYRLAENYYYHTESLAPAEDADFANIWFWDKQQRSLTKQEVGRVYFYELMTMRVCELALKADADYGKAIGLWLAAFYKAESAGIAMPGYFGEGHATASVYATTAGPEYLHQALARALKDKNAYVALSVVEALGQNAGEKSLLYRLAMEQPLLSALSFDDKAVRYSAAIAVANAGPKEFFAESRIAVQNLAEALSEQSGEYPIRAAQAMLKLAVERNPVIDLSAAQGTLIDATKDDRQQIKVLAAEILAHLSGPQGQQAIAKMALAEENLQQIRIAAFSSLAKSAKINGSLLGDDHISAIYELVSSTEADADLRSAAAAAYGALNLPSEKVKNLILDQAKS